MRPVVSHRAPAGIVLVAVLLAAGCRGPEEAPPPRLSLTATLGGGDTVGYRRAVEPRSFEFPLDHGPHPGFRSEWWYLTGNLAGDDGRRFGFQLTIFRSALSPVARVSPSAWATDQAYMAHFALTDADAGRFHAHERFARGAVGLAGARAEPLRVWLEDWSIEGADGQDPFPLTVRAGGPDVALGLTLAAGKPRVLQGERGLSRKGPEPGNASYYYSRTRMPADGVVVVVGDTLRVSGSAWLDREWSTSVLSDGVVGWDWFALQLDDGWDLMLYRLRRADGSATPYSEGVLVDPEGAPTRLAWGDGVRMDATGSWTSPTTGARYPSGWRIEVPARAWRLELEPLLDDQELDVSIRYWEGAVRVRSPDPGGPSGYGYVELTGYDGAPLRR